MKYSINNAQKNNSFYSYSVSITVVSHFIAKTGGKLKKAKIQVNGSARTMPKAQLVISTEKILPKAYLQMMHRDLLNHLQNQ